MLASAAPQATFDAARKPLRHPTKPGVTAVRSVPILPDFGNWPNKYVVVHFPEGDPANDSRTLAMVGVQQIVLLMSQVCAAGGRDALTGDEHCA